MQANENPLEKLRRLSASRSLRTEKLRLEVVALLSALAQHVKPGESVTVDRWTLSRETVYLDQEEGYLDQEEGYVERDEDYWLLEPPEGGLSYALDRRSGHDCPPAHQIHRAFAFPDRRALVEFGLRAERFVQALLQAREAECTQLDSALQRVEAARAEA